jgi:hypothetical protein
MVALCRPQEVEPLSIVMRYDPVPHEVFYLPDPRKLPSDLLPVESLRLEVTGLTKPFPPFTLEPARPVAPQETVEVRLHNPQLPPTELQVEFDVQSQTAQFTVTPLCELPRLARPSQTEELKTADAFAAGEKETRGLKPFQPDPFWDLVGKLRKRASRASLKTKEGEWVQTQLSQCKALHGLMEELHKANPGKNKDDPNKGDVKAVYFRVFRQVGDRQVNLLVARAPKSDAKSKPAAEKKP